MPVIHSAFGRSGRDDEAWIVFGSPLFSPSRVPRRPAFGDGGFRSENTPENLVLKADLRGMREDEVKMKVEAGVLQLWGEQRMTPMTRDGRRGDAEVRPFRRRIPLPDDAEGGLLRSTVKNGVLVITVPKRDVGTVCLPAL